MPELNFTVEGADTLRFAAVPTLVLRLRITDNDAGQQIQNVLLTCQIQIEANRRRYNRAEQARLEDLFGEPSRWSRTLRPLHWTYANVMVPPFEGSIDVDLLVPCSFDFNVASTKYFHGLQEGELPLNLLFSGTIFYPDDAGNLQAT